MKTSEKAVYVLRNSDGVMKVFTNLKLLYSSIVDMNGGESTKLTYNNLCKERKECLNNYQFFVKTIDLNDYYSIEIQEVFLNN